MTAPASETDFGQVDVFGILIDTFDDEAGAEGFFDYLSDDPTGEPTDFLDGIDDVSGAIEFDLGTGNTETMIVAIQIGNVRDHRSLHRVLNSRLRR